LKNLQGRRLHHLPSKCFSPPAHLMASPDLPVLQHVGCKQLRGRQGPQAAWGYADHRTWSLLRLLLFFQILQRVCGECVWKGRGGSCEQRLDIAEHTVSGLGVCWGHPASYRQGCWGQRC
uniref:Uncharacterized protein n=1 Tax=Chrysemys picta bellii TaxID=8478 RepID=A0A8C3IYL1_CHRPI